MNPDRLHWAYRYYMCWGMHLRWHHSKLSRLFTRISQHIIHRMAVALCCWAYSLCNGDVQISADKGAPLVGNVWLLLFSKPGYYLSYGSRLYDLLCLVRNGFMDRKMCAQLKPAWSIFLVCVVGFIVNFIPSVIPLDDWNVRMHNLIAFSHLMTTNRASSFFYTFKQTVIKQLPWRSWRSLRRSSSLIYEENITRCDCLSVRISLGWTMVPAIGRRGLSCTIRLIIQN